MVSAGPRQAITALEMLGSHLDQAEEQPAPPRRESHLCVWWGEKDAGSLPSVSPHSTASAFKAGGFLTQIGAREPPDPVMRGQELFLNQAQGSWTF